MGKGKVVILKDAIHDEHEFAHAGSQGDHWSFSGFAEALIEGFENGVVADGAKRGYIKGATDG